MNYKPTDKKHDDDDKKDEKAEPAFDTAKAVADIASDALDAIRKLPEEQQEAVLRDVKIQMFFPKNVGAAPQIRGAVTEVPNENDPGVRPVLTSEFVKGNTDTVGIPNASPTAQRLIAEDNKPVKKA